jgi:hypothetical protein
MKVVVALLLLFVVGWVVVYYAGGYATFDPVQQARDAKAALKPGMPWQQAFDITGDPPKYRPIFKKEKKIGGETIVSYVPGAPNKFSRSTVGDRLANNSLPHGFICTLVYSTSIAFTLEFDGAGALVNVSDAPTMADLLQYPKD